MLYNHVKRSFFFSSYVYFTVQNQPKVLFLPLVVGICDNLFRIKFIPRCLNSIYTKFCSVWQVLFFYNRLLNTLILIIATLSYSVCTNILELLSQYYIVIVTPCYRNAGITWGNISNESLILEKHFYEIRRNISNSI